MVKKTYQYEKIEETLHTCRFKNGLRAYVIQKKGYHKKYAAFAVNYGSIDNRFIVPGEAQPIVVPDGIAHFLEHKLFEQKDGNVMDKYAELGSSPNAYTGFSQTVYLVSCTDNFNENFELLLNFVQNPYITDESVENEKGIIGQEIQMYQDDPGWQAYFTLLRLFYPESPVSTEIAGSIDSISKIDKETLYKCYNTFYHPSNMIVLAVGDLSPDEIFGLVGKKVGDAEQRAPIRRMVPEEKGSVSKDYNEKKLPVSNPLFQMGFRDTAVKGTGPESIEREIAVNILLEIILGRSSELYEELYAQNFLSGVFEFNYLIEEGYAFSLIGGESKDPVKVKDIFLDRIEKIKQEGIPRNDFERIKKSMYGKFMKQLNSVERVSNSFISVCFRDIIIFDYVDVYDKISFESVSQIFKEHFDRSNFALSVIKPV